MVIFLRCDAIYSKIINELTGGSFSYTKQRALIGFATSGPTGHPAGGSTNTKLPTRF